MYNQDDDNNNNDNNNNSNGFMSLLKCVLIIVFMDIIFNVTFKQPDAAVSNNAASSKETTVNYKYLGIMMNENKEVIHYWYSKNIYKSENNTYKVEDSNGQYIDVTSSYFINIPVKNDKDLVKIKTEYNIK